MGRILVVDDEPAFVRSLLTNLRVRGYETDMAVSGEQALRLAARRHPDAIILDLGLPGIGGIDVIGDLRRWTTVPIVVLSASGDEGDKVMALDAGADDYVAKPVGMDELFARLRAVLRRSLPPNDTVVRTASFSVDLVAKQVLDADGAVIHLTPIEYRLLEVLARNAGRLVPATDLLDQIWGPGHGGDTNALRVHLTHLRQKVEPAPSAPRHVLTEPGFGYRLEVGPPALLASGGQGSKR